MRSTFGETGNYLRRQVTVHNQQIRDPKTRILFVSEHCEHLCSPNEFQSFMFSCFIKCT